MHIGIITPVSAAQGFFLTTPFIAPLVEDFIQKGLSVSLYGFVHAISEICRGQSGRLDWILVPHRKKMAFAMADGFAVERAALVKLINENPPELIHAHWTQFGHALAALGTGLPCVVTVHDAAKECARLNSINLRPIVWFCNGRQVQITRDVLRRAQHVIAVSPFVADHIRNVFGYRGEVRTIPNAVPVGDEAAVKRKIEQEITSRPVFVSIGHWGRLKNIKSLIRAFAMVRDAVPAAELILIGNGLGSGGPAAKWAANRKLADGVQFRGSLPHQEVLRVLAETADILVHPSRSEGFGMTLAEALANGVAVIANRAGAMPWVLDEGRAGLLVSAEHPNELADAMIRLVRDDKLRKELTLYGYQMVRRRFDPKKIAEQHLACYKEILEKE